MQNSVLARVVRRQRAIERVVSVRGDKYVVFFYFAARARSDSDRDGRVEKVAASVAQLNNVADFRLFERNDLGERSDPVVADEKVVQKLNARPRRRAVARGAVKPAVQRQVVHNAATRKNALRREVCTVAAYVVKIVKRGISAERPFTSVSYGGGAIVSVNVHAIGI